MLGRKQATLWRGSKRLNKSIFDLRESNGGGILERIAALAFFSSGKFFRNFYKNRLSLTLRQTVI